MRYIAIYLERGMRGNDCTRESIEATNNREAFGKAFDNRGWEAAQKYFEIDEQDYLIYGEDEEGNILVVTLVS